MLSKDPAIYLLEIRDSIDRIFFFLGSMAFDDYLLDLKTRRAVERELQILTEVAFRLRDVGEQLAPDVNWRALRNFGNFLRHSYDRVDDLTVWNTLTDDLPVLRSSVVSAIARSELSSNAAPSPSQDTRP